MQTHRRTYSTDSCYPEKHHSSCPHTEHNTRPKPSAFIAENRFSVVGKWFCDRLLRVRVPQSPASLPPKTLQEDLITRLQSFRPMSEEESESDTLNNVIKGCSQQVHLAVGVMGHGADCFLNSILETSLEDETTCSLVEHPSTGFHLRSPSLDAMDTRSNSLSPSLSPTVSIKNISVPLGGFILPENEISKESSVRVTFRYGTCPELLVQFQKDFRTSSTTLLKGKVLVGQRARFVGQGKDSRKDLVYLRQKLHMLQQSFTEHIEGIEFRLPSHLLRGNREFVFYGSHSPRCEDSFSKLLGVHCLVCVVGEEGLSSSSRNFLVQSGFLHKLIRHPLDFQILFLLDQSRLCSFSPEEQEAILRQQFVALLKEHAPGPYAVTAPRLAATTKVLPIQPQRYVELCQQQSSYYSKQETGLPTVLATLQNLSLCHCADPITNISQDWIQKSSRTSQISKASEKIEELPVATTGTLPRRAASERLSGDLTSAFRSSKSEIITETRNVDLILAKGAKRAFLTWNQLHKHFNIPQENFSLSDSLQEVISQSFLSFLPSFLHQQQLLSDKLPEHLKVIEQCSSSLLADCLRTAGVLKSHPSEVDKVRVKRLAEFTRTAHQRVLSRSENIRKLLCLANPQQLLSRASQHVLMNSSLQIANSPRPLLVRETLSHLPLKVIQHVRLQVAELSSESLSLLTCMEEEILASQTTVLRVLRYSHQELQQKAIREILVTPHTSKAHSCFVPFRPFTNLVFDHSDWSLLSFLSTARVPNQLRFDKQLQEYNLHCASDLSKSALSPGNSQFRSLAHQIYGNEVLFPIVRFLLCHEIVKNKTRYEPYFYASHFDLQEYVHRMSHDGEPGDHITLLAFANYYKVNVWLFSPISHVPVFIASCDRKGASLCAPRYLSYYQGKLFASLTPTAFEDSSMSSKKRLRDEGFDFGPSPPSKRQCIDSLQDNTLITDSYEPMLGAACEDTEMTEINHSVMPHRRGGGISSLVELCTRAIAQNIQLLPALGGCVPLDVVQPILRNLIRMGRLNDEILQRLLDGLFVDSLNVSHCKEMDYACCTVIAQHRESLRVLDISDCYHIPDEGFRLLLHSFSPSGSNSLQFLNISGCQQLTNFSLQQIASHSPQLRSINLDGCIDVRDTAIYDLLENCYALEELSTVSCVHITDKAFTSSSSSLRLQKVNVERCTNITDEGVTAIAHRCGNKLRSITLSGKRIGDPSLQALAGWATQLKSLYLHSTLVTDTGLRCISLRCEELETLSIPSSSQLSCLMFHPTQGSLNHVPDWKPFPALRELTLSFCENVDDTTLEAIAHWLPPLQYLELAGCEKISDRGCNQLLQRSMSNLIHLNVSQCPLITDVSVVQVALSCPAIEFICFSYCKEITDFSMEYLCSHASLVQHLDVSACPKISDEGFALFNFPLLKTLRLEEASISDGTAAKVISRSPMLQNISLSFCKDVKEKTMAALATCKDLEFLDVSYCNSISFDCLQKTLYELPNLYELSIRGYVNLSDKMLSHASLRVLDISWCKELKDSAIHSLLQAMPSLEKVDASWCSSLSIDLLQRTAVALRTFVAKGL